MEVGKKYCVLDVETTGLNPKQHTVVQIAGAVILGEEVVEAFEFYTKPHRGCLVSKRALEVNGLTVEQLESFDSPNIIHKELLALLGKYVNKFDKGDKLHLIGYNCHSFDVPFLRAWFDRCGDKYFGSFFHHPSIDVMLLAAFVLRHERAAVGKFNLANVCQYCGITVDETATHDARYDVNLTYTLYTILLEKLYAQR